MGPCGNFTFLSRGLAIMLDHNKWSAETTAAIKQAVQGSNFQII